jgi:hypothetical protein
VKLELQVDATAFTHYEVLVQGVTSAGVGDASAPQSTITLATGEQLITAINNLSLFF